MKKLSFSMSFLVGLVAASSAWGVESAPSAGGGLLFLLFLGVCALVIVAQMVPAMLLLMEWIPGHVRKSDRKGQMALVMVTSED